MGIKELVRSVCQVLVFTGFLVASQFSSAEVSPGFFQSEQLVENQSSSSRIRAINRGFTEILVRLSGSKQILLRPELRKALQNPRSFLQKYTYFTSSDDGVETQWVRLEFNGDQIERLFYEHKLPLWSKERPPLVFWLGVDAGQGREIVANQSSDEVMVLKEQVIKAAALQGLTVRFPNMDEQDQLTINLSDIWSLDMNSITNASRRYNARLVSLGKMSRSPSGAWYGQWGIEFEGRAYWYEGSAQGFDSLIANIMEDFAAELGRAYAFEVGHEVEESVLLAVENINTLKDYSEVSRVLEDLLSVSHVALKEAQPGQLLLEVVVQGGVAQLVPSLKLKSNLRALAQPVNVQQEVMPIETVDAMDVQAPVVTPKTVLNYRWFGG